MLKKLMVASAFGLCLAINATVHIETELKIQDQSMKHEADVAFSERATLSIEQENKAGFVDFHITVLDTVEQAGSDIKLVLDLEVRDGKDTITSRGSGSVESNWGSPVLFTIVPDQEEGGPVTLAVTVTKN